VQGGGDRRLGQEPPLPVELEDRPAPGRGVLVEQAGATKPAGTADEDREDRSRRGGGALIPPLAPFEAGHVQLIALAVVAAPSDQRSTAGGGRQGGSDVGYGVGPGEAAHGEPGLAHAAA